MEKGKKGRGENGEREKREEGKKGMREEGRKDEKGRRETRRAVASVCTGCGAVSHAAVSCRVQCGFNF